MDQSNEGSIEKLSSLTKSQYSQVIFHDLWSVYSTHEDLKCTYSLTDSVKPQPGDKIALFKVGWIYVSEYVSFQRVAISTNETDSHILQVIFPAGTLPKDDELYQFCYITSGNVVAGASVPFSFRQTKAEDFVEVQDPSDPSFVIFDTKTAYLESKLNEAKEHISHEEQQRSLFEKLLTERDDEITKLKQNLHNLNDIIEEKNMLNNQLTEKTQTLSQQLSNEEQLVKNLKTVNTSLNNEQVKIQLELEEKCSLINQLEEDISRLTVNNKSLEEKAAIDRNIIDHLEKELDQSKDNLKKLETTLQENIEQKERQSLERQELDRQFQSLVETVNIKTAEKLNYQKELNEFKLLLEQKETDIAACQESLSRMDKANNEKRKINQECMNSDGTINFDAALLKSEDEKGILQGQCDSLEDLIQKKESEYKQTIIKLREELLRERKNMESLKKKFNDEIAMDAIDPSPRASTSTESNGKIYSYPDNEMQEKMKSVIEQRADLRSELISIRHENQELSKIINKVNEENGALKSRVQVLEFELSDAMKTSQTGEMSHMKYLLGSVNEKIDTLSLHVMPKRNDPLPSIQELQHKLKESELEIYNYKDKVAYLLAQDAELCAKLNAKEQKLVEITQLYEESKKVLFTNNLCSQVFQ